MSELARRHAAVVAEHGPWQWCNVDLGGGVWTMPAPPSPAAEQRVARVLRLVADNLADGLAGARVLDLGAGEGAFALELALQGADVVAVEGREGNAARARFAAEALGLANLEVVHADVQELTSLGTFDVILCLGVLYHLEAAPALALVRRVAESTSRLAIFETQIALSGRRVEQLDGKVYRGRSYPEDAVERGAALVSGTSFWPTKASLLNMLSAAGFTSVAEVRVPIVPEVDAFRDHTTLVAIRGRPLEAASISGSPEAPSHPERLPLIAHPSQGPAWRAREWVARRRGAGLGAIFRRPD
jgi:SAM-dependent methyltransferase